MMNSCSAHCWCCTGWDGQGSRALPAAAVLLAVLGFAGRRVIDGVATEG